MYSLGRVPARWGVVCGCGFVLYVFVGGRGLQDPCEKGCVDAAAELTAQERADLTLTAQVL